MFHMTDNKPRYAEGIGIGINNRACTKRDALANRMSRYKQYGGGRIFDILNVCFVRSHFKVHCVWRCESFNVQRIHINDSR